MLSLFSIDWLPLSVLVNKSTSFVWRSITPRKTSPLPIGQLTAYVDKFNSDSISSNKDIDKDIEPNFIESFDEEETSEEILTLENSLTEEGAREQLIALREKISNENPDSKSWRSVLRNSMLKNILEKRITNLEDFKKNISGPEFRKTDESNFVYFDQIKLVIDRIKDD